MPKLVSMLELLFVFFKAAVGVIILLWLLNVSAAVWQWGWPDFMQWMSFGLLAIGFFVGYNAKAIKENADSRH